MSGRNCIVIRDNRFRTDAGKGPDVHVFADARVLFNNGTGCDMSSFTNPASSQNGRVIFYSHVAGNTGIVKNTGIIFSRHDHNINFVARIINKHIVPNLRIFANRAPSVNLASIANGNKSTKADT